IENKCTSSIDVKIYNISGTLLNEKEIINNESIEINNSKGIFIVQIIESESKFNFSEKVIKY
ncbi:MAG: T9SS type A sorting domain-containing protein, partial [Bacteroidales bacterium]|nr:T9SS type A sorting domain-containing protein [Bacteroidales bacterium]